MNDKKVWRSIKFPINLAEEIEKIAQRERRSFSAQALIFIEESLGALDRQEQEAVRE